MSAGLRLYRGLMSGLRPALEAVARAGGGNEREARLGFVPEEPAGAVWAHASSVGELGGVAAFERELRAQAPAAALRVTCQTRSGLVAARTRMGLRADLAPWDTPFAVRRRIERTRPCALLMFETELWPILLSEAVRRVPVAWVNGRVGPRTMNGAWRLRPLLRPSLARVSAFAVQTDSDARGFESLGARPERILAVGNLKHDRPAPARPPRSELGLREIGRVVVFGSLREGEAAAAVGAYVAARAAHTELNAVFAPRKAEFLPELLRELARAGQGCGRRSANAQECRVLVLDTLGELAAAYTLADISFVGGSLVPAGGHDVLEAARAGSPVLFGPHTGNCAQDARELLAAGGGRRVADARELSAALLELLAQPRAREAMAAAAGRVATVSRGAAARAIAWLRQWGALPGPEAITGAASPGRAGSVP